MNNILNDTNIICNEIKEKLDKCIELVELTNQLLDDFKELKGYPQQKKN